MTEQNNIDKKQTRVQAETAGNQASSNQTSSSSNNNISNNNANNRYHHPGQHNHHNVVIKPRITVLGTGGAGCNAVENMLTSGGLEEVKFVVCNTDAQALERSKCPHKIQLGPMKTGGLGAGGDPVIGEAAAEESMHEVMNMISDSHMLFITAGAGGGTGSGSAHVIAKAARDKGILTIGFVTKPFSFEGRGRSKIAKESIEKLQDSVDCLIIAQNQNLMEMNNSTLSVLEAFSLIDAVLGSGVRGIVNVIARPGVINVDFQDAMKVMKNRMSRVVFGVGTSEGDGAGSKAAEIALSNPLLELDDQTLQKVDTALVSVTGGPNLSLQAVEAAVDYLRSQISADDDNIIVGMNVLPDMGDKVEVCIFASCPKLPVEAHVEDSDVAHSMQKNQSAQLRQNLAGADKYIVRDVTTSMKYDEMDEEVIIGKPHLNLQEESTGFSFNRSANANNAGSSSSSINSNSGINKLFDKNDTDPKKDSDNKHKTFLDSLLGQGSKWFGKKKD